MVLISLPASSNFFKVPVGIIELLFVPGYLILAVLFPSGVKLSQMEHFGLSIGLSICISTLLGYFLNFTPWGITHDSIVTALLVNILILVAVVAFRRYSQKIEPFVGVISVSIWHAGAALILTISIGTFIFLEQRLPEGRPFTEFSLLGDTSSSDQYPYELQLGRSANFRIEVVNRNSTKVNYRIQAMLDGDVQTLAPTFELKPDESRQNNVSFIPKNATPKSKLIFELFEGESANPSQMASVWVSVSQAPTKAPGSTQ